MTRTLIQQYATGIVKGLFEQADSIKGLEHKLLKGHLREVFVANVLNRYLTSQFGVGSGIVVNQNGGQSNETDIIIYDNRVLPPFIREERLGVFPIEAVVATIEVKSIVSTAEILAANEAAKKLHEVVASASGSFYSANEIPTPPNCSFFGFCDGGVKELKGEEAGRKWLIEKVSHLKSICVMRNFAWVKLAQAGWRLHITDEFDEDTKTYIGVLLDNIRTLGEKNYSLLSGKHRDWVSLYTRDNEGVKRIFESRNDDSKECGTSGQ
jgi:hypothetical protein